MVVANDKLTKRLAKYSAAAVAAAATGFVATDVDADLVSVTGLNLSTSNSLEGFLDIFPFVQGASTVGYAFANSSFSVGNPLGGPATDFMIRAIFAASTGTAFMAPRNGNFAYGNYYYVGGPYNTGSYFMFENVGSAFNPAGGSFIAGLPGSTTGGAFLVTWPWNGNPGGFGAGSGTIPFLYLNPTDSQFYNGWLDVAFGADGGGNFQMTITGYHIDTLPEPGSALTMLCMGAAGLAGYRRRRQAA
jgi:hypothetical protein